MMNNRPGITAIALAAATALLLPMASMAVAPGGETDFSQVPMSIRQAGSGLVYGSYDVFKPDHNPSLLAQQPKTWEAGFTNGFMFGGDENIMGLGVGWVGRPTDSGTFGAGLSFSWMSMGSFDRVDIWGDKIGTISPMGYRIAVPLLYQWNFFSLGVKPSWAAVDLSGAADAYDTLGVDAGTTLTLGRLDVGVVYRFSTNSWMNELSFGAAFRWSNGQAGFDVGLPFSVASSSAQSAQSSQQAAASYPTNYALGLNWDILRWFGLRTGISVDSGGTSKMKYLAGFSVPYRNWILEYALDMPLSDFSELGSSHLIGLRWIAGAERKAAEGPKFFMKEAERTMAVSNFDPQNVSAGDAAVISDMLRSELINQGAFNIAEKANMDKILQEQAFQQTGCTTAECAVKLGKLLNVRYLVVGSFGKALDQYVLNMRVVDIETSKAIYSDTSYGKDLPGVREGIVQMAKRLTEAVKKAK